MFPDRAPERTGSDSVNDENFVPSLRRSKVERLVEPIDCFFDAEATQILLDETAEASRGQRSRWRA
jgi:hypothetical protein